tara:strand:- start:24017 stop:24451 length:435 start_codon:yes stop_codon:yes gene_type:complete
MITLEAHYVYLLLGSNAIMLALACLCFTRFDRRCQQLEEFWGSPTGTALNESQDATSVEQLQATQRLEQRIAELHQQLKRLESGNGDRDAPTVERSVPIENAVRMARRGASVDDLTRNCGLNIGEARLMQKLHGQAQPGASGVH